MYRLTRGKVFDIGLVSLTECAEYQDQLKERISVAVGFNEPVVKEILRCEHASVPLVVGGEQAKSKEFPHMVCILWGSRYSRYSPNIFGKQSQAGDDG